MAKLVNANMTLKTKEKNLRNQMIPRVKEWYTSTRNQTRVIAGDSPSLLLTRTIPFEVAVKLIGTYVHNPNGMHVFDGCIYEMLRASITTATICAINDYLESAFGVRQKDCNVMNPKLEFLINEFFSSDRYTSGNVMNEWIDNVIARYLSDNPIDIKRESFVAAKVWINRIVSDTFIPNYQNYRIDEKWKPVFDRCMENPTDLDFFSKYSMPEYVHEDKEMEAFAHVFAEPFLASLDCYNRTLMRHAKFNEETFMFLPRRLGDGGFKDGKYIGMFVCNDSVVLYATQYNKFIDSDNEASRSKDCISAIVTAKSPDRSCRIEIRLVDLMTVISGKTDIESYQSSCRRFFAAFKNYTIDFIGVMTEVFATNEINSSLNN